MAPVTDELRSAYIRSDPPGKVDREAILHRRRKQAMVSLLTQFEQEIVPLVAEGHDQAIEDFKRSCREKLNALTFEAAELLKLEPGEDLNECAADLAGKLAFGDNDGGPE
jgi:hypothetical protein